MKKNKIKCSWVNKFKFQLNNQILRFTIETKRIYKNGEIW